MSTVPPCGHAWFYGDWRITPPPPLPAPLPVEAATCHCGCPIEREPLAPWLHMNGWSMCSLSAPGVLAAPLLAKAA